MENELKITLKQGEATAYIESVDHGAIRKKQVYIEDLCKLFEVKTDKVYQMPVCLFEPKTELEKTLLYGKQGSRYVKGVFFLPESIRYMNFAGQEFMIPYPSMLVYLEANNGRRLNGKAVCVKEPVLEKIQMKSLCYNFPFGNVNQLGQMCFGSILYEINLETFESLYQMLIKFMTSESNRDYVSPGISYKGGEYEAFLALLQKKEKFPKDKLVKSMAYYYVEDFMKLMEN